MPVTVVPTSLATVAMETFMTELSKVMRNCAVASVSRTRPPERPARASGTRGILADGGSVWANDTPLGCAEPHLSPPRVLPTVHRVGVQCSVGMRGFEPRTSCSQSRRAAKLRHIPFSLLMKLVRILAL